MLFSSILFLWIFLPIVIIGNGILSVISFKDEVTRYKWKNMFLLLASLIFYAWGGIYYLILMLTVILLNYAGGYLIDKYKEKKTVILVGTIALNLALLFYFKYFNLFISVLESITKNEQGAFGFKEVILPIGISFYIFQAMSYVIDVYRERTKVQNNIFCFALYVSLFPQLIAGPIVQYKDVESQIWSRVESYEKFADGIKRFCYGLGKKVIISNTLAEVVDQIFICEAASFGADIAWLGMISYTLQIYYDFSGYSDMAIGLGKMLGFDFKENFNYPYTSLSVSEFWRRWHISLSSWFRDYVYIPLGGSRGSLFKTCLNLFVVFFLTGVWHGANFTFFTWGMYYAVILIIERVFLSKLLDKNPIKIVNWMYTTLLVMLGWVIFNAQTLEYALAFIGNLFVFERRAVTMFNFLNMKYILVLFLAVLFSGFIQRMFKNVYEKYSHKLLVMVGDYAIQVVLLVYSIILIVSGTYNPFIYFQF